jgi:hypothetical protein
MDAEDSVLDILAMYCSLHVRVLSQVLRHPLCDHGMQYLYVADEGENVNARETIRIAFTSRVIPLFKIAAPTPVVQTWDIHHMYFGGKSALPETWPTKSGSGRYEFLSPRGVQRAIVRSTEDAWIARKM